MEKTKLSHDNETRDKQFWLTMLGACTVLVAFSYKFLGLAVIPIEMLMIFIYIQTNGQYANRRIHEEEPQTETMEEAHSQEEKAEENKEKIKTLEQQIELRKMKYAHKEKMESERNQVLITAMNMVRDSQQQAGLAEKYTEIAKMNQNFSRKERYFHEREKILSYELGLNKGEKEGLKLGGVSADIGLSAGGPKIFETHAKLNISNAVAGEGIKALGSTAFFPQRLMKAIPNMVKSE